VVPEVLIEQDLNSLAVFKKGCDGGKSVAVDEYVYWTEHVPVD